jgi:hypothetical protein
LASASPRNLLGVTETVGVGEGVDGHAWFTTATGNSSKMPDCAKISRYPVRLPLRLTPKINELVVG